MPNRKIVASELGGLLRVLSHQDRILIIQLLAKRGEHDVSSIAEELDLPDARVSQHLSVLRTYRIVQEERQGRRRIYSLAMPDMAPWLLDGVDFVAGLVTEVTREQVDDARALWARAFTEQ
ncbi:MAG: metalloregulator ArsR/SmtB family transcription factor [Pseudomonadota bacterium]